MVTRLTAGSAVTRPAWSVSKGYTRRPFCFDQALARLREHRLAFDPARGEGVVLYVDAPSDGRSWRYAVISANADGVGEWDAWLSQAMEFESI
jgi:hypothetical protein